MAQNTSPRRSPENTLVRCLNHLTWKCSRFTSSPYQFIMLWKKLFCHFGICDFIFFRQDSELVSIGEVRNADQPVNYQFHFFSPAQWAFQCSVYPSHPAANQPSVSCRSLQSFTTATTWIISHCRNHERDHVELCSQSLTFFFFYPDLIWHPHPCCHDCPAPSLTNYTKYTYIFWY